MHIWTYESYAHFEAVREAGRSDPRWVNDYVPRLRGLIVKQQDMIMRGGDFFPGPT